MGRPNAFASLAPFRLRRRVQHPLEDRLATLRRSTALRQSPARPRSARPNERLADNESYRSVGRYPSRPRQILAAAPVAACTLCWGHYCLNLTWLTEKICSQKILPKISSVKNLRWVFRHEVYVIDGGGLSPVWPPVPLFSQDRGVPVGVWEGKCDLT